MVTFGAQTVLARKELVLIANGEKKAAIIKQALEGPIKKMFPRQFCACIQSNGDFRS